MGVMGVIQSCFNTKDMQKTALDRQTSHALEGLRTDLNENKKKIDFQEGRMEQLLDEAKDAKYAAEKLRPNDFNRQRLMTKARQCLMDKKQIEKTLQPLKSEDDNLRKAISSLEAVHGRTSSADKYRNTVNLIYQHEKYYEIEGVEQVRDDLKMAIDNAENYYELSRQPITISDNEIDMELNNLSTSDNFINDNEQLSSSTDDLLKSQDVLHMPGRDRDRARSTTPAHDTFYEVN